MDFESVGSEIKSIRNELFVEADEQCELHEINLVQGKNEKLFCPKCAIEKLKKSEEELLMAETEKAYNQNKGWLKKNSFLSDRSMFDMRFSNYDEMDRETKMNKQKALKLARNYYDGCNNNSMLSGKYGSGKTHLAMAILNELNQHTDMKLMFVSMDELMRRIKSSFGNKQSEYREDLVNITLVEADLLVLDDMGAEVGSVNRRSEANDFTVQVINGILNGRTNKPTIFTTNLGRTDMETVYDGRIVSRIMRGIDEERVIQFKETTDKRLKIDF